MTAFCVSFLNAVGLSLFAPFDAFYLDAKYIIGIKSVWTLNHVSEWMFRILVKYLNMTMWMLLG